MVPKLAAHFEVLIHDQRALGCTTVPYDQPTMADCASDAAALLDHVGWPTTLVFGISFGGMVALEFAVTWPARMNRWRCCALPPVAPEAVALRCTQWQRRRQTSRPDCGCTSPTAATHPSFWLRIRSISVSQSSAQLAALRLGLALSCEERRCSSLLGAITTCGPVWAPLPAPCSSRSVGSMRWRRRRTAKPSRVASPAANLAAIKAATGSSGRTARPGPTSSASCRRSGGRSLGVLGSGLRDWTRPEPDLARNPPRNKLRAQMGLSGVSAEYRNGVGPLKVNPVRHNGPHVRA